MTSELHNFYLLKEEPNKSCLLTLRALILKQDDLIRETRKYGMPCFCYKNKMFCYLWVAKKTDIPYILFVEGKHLEHPHLERGTRNRMKVFHVDPSLTIEVKQIEELLNKALNLYRDGIIQTK